MLRPLGGSWDAPAVERRGVVVRGRSRACNPAWAEPLDPNSATFLRDVRGFVRGDQSQLLLGWRTCGLLNTGFTPITLSNPEVMHTNIPGTPMLRSWGAVSQFSAVYSRQRRSPPGAAPPPPTIGEDADGGVVACKRLGSVRLTLHWSSGPVPALVIVTVYPSLCSCAMVPAAPVSAIQLKPFSSFARQRTVVPSFVVVYETGGRYLSDEVAAVDVPRCGGVDSGASVLM